MEGCRRLYYSSLQEEKYWRSASIFFLFKKMVFFLQEYFAVPKNCRTFALAKRNKA